MSRCRDCQAEVLWGMTVPRDPDKTPVRIPMDVEMVRPGSKRALACVPDAGQGMLVYGRTLLIQRLIAERGLTEDEARQFAFRTFPWRISHVNTCPQRQP